MPSSSAAYAASASGDDSSDDGTFRGWPLGASVRVTAAAGEGEGELEEAGEAEDGEALVVASRRLRVDPAGERAGVAGSEEEEEAEARDEDEAGERSEEPAAAATPRSSEASLDARVCGCVCGDDASSTEAAAAAAAEATGALGASTAGPATANRSTDFLALGGAGAVGREVDRYAGDVHRRRS